MRNLSLVALLLLSSPVFLASTCSKSKSSSCDDVACTMIFAAVSVQVVDAANAPVKLDEVYTVRKSTGQKIKPDQHMAEGRYVILDDSYQKTIQNSSEVFVLGGMKDGKRVVSETYTISADCCHVKKGSGKEKITI